MMSKLKIHRVNKSTYQLRDGKKVIKECGSYKQAMNALIAADLDIIDSFNDFMDSELDDLDLMESFNEAA